MSAGSAVLLAADTGTVLYERDARTSRPMASTTKIMTALLTLEEAESRGDPVVTVTAEMVAVEGSSMGLEPGDQLALSDLAAGMLLASGNDAANAAALYLDGSLEQFVRRMNLRASSIGMEDTCFVTPSGLDGENPAGQAHSSTAYDMALLAREALQNQRFRELCSSVEYTVQFLGSEKKLTLTNHNRLLREYPGCVGVKTGYTKQAGRCLVSAAQREGVLLIAVTLSAPDDWQDHTALLDYGFSQVEVYPLGSEAVRFLLPVTGADRESVPVAGQGEEKISLTAEQREKLSCRVYAPRFLYAPVAAGDRVGEIRYYAGNRLLRSVPLKAEEAAPAAEPKPGLWERLFGMES